MWAERKKKKNQVRIRSAKRAFRVRGGEESSGPRHQRWHCVGVAKGKAENKGNKAGFESLSAHRVPGAVPAAWQAGHTAKHIRNSQKQNCTCVQRLKIKKFFFQQYGFQTYANDFICYSDEEKAFCSKNGEKPVMLK